MLKENWRLIARIERCADFVIIIASFFISYYGRDSILYWDERFGLRLPFTGPELAPIKDYFIVLFVALVGYLSTLAWFDAYGSMRLSSPWRLLRISFSSSGIVFVGLAATLFLLKIDLSRSFVLLFCVLTAFLLCGERLVVLQLLRFWRRRGKNFRNVLICGIGDQALRIVHEIAPRPELGIRIRGFVDLREHSTPEERSAALGEIQKFRAELRVVEHAPSLRVLDGVKAVENALKQYAIDEVIFTDVVQVMPAVREVVCICAEEGVRTTIAADLFSVGLIKSGISFFGGMPLIHFQTPPGDQWELNLKRFIDVMASAVLLVLLSPLMAGVAAAVSLSSPGSILFRQRRIGLNGRTFYLYKFRSMHVGAEKQIEQLRNKNEMKGPVFKISDDPRVTPVGRFLRKHSLDELPQLWNVFVGDMSLVGPRPPVPGEVSLYERKDRRRLSMRPGLTCIWQVSGRNNIRDFESWVKLDLEYIDNWSLGLDFALLMRTIPAVLFGSGAR
jgi:exopolysaccharide biosynthesis polyprenyl glycosylphosphotransferase